MSKPNQEKITFASLSQKTEVTMLSVSKLMTDVCRKADEIKTESWKNPENQKLKMKLQALEKYQHMLTAQITYMDTFGGRLGLLIGLDSYE
jgi:hypothetical protein